MKKKNQAVLPGLTDQPGESLYTVCVRIRESSILMTERRKESHHDQNRQ